jgi:MFS family permease
VSLHATTWEAAVLAAVQKTPPLLFSLPAGAWCDRVRKRPLMMATSLISAAAMASIPLAASYDRLTLIQLWVAAFVVGSCHVVGMTASLSYIPHLLPPLRLLEANAKLAGANTLADIGGPALAGALIGLIGAARAVAADAVSYLVTAWCTLRIRSPETAPSPRTARPGLRSEIRAGLAYTWRHPVIGPLVTTNAITSTVLAGTNAIWVVYLIRELNWSAQAFAIVMSIGASGGFLASLTTPRLAARYGAGPVMITALTLAPASQLPLLLADPGLAGQLGIGCGLFAQLFGAVTHGLTQRTVRQRACTPDMQGRMQATGQWTAFGLRPFAALLAGYAGTTLGLRTTLALGACLLILPPLRLALTPIRTLRLAAT